MRDIFLNFRSQSDGDLTGTETTAYVYVGAAAPKGTPVVIEVPEQDAAGDTLTITFREATDSVGTGARQIGNAQPVVTGASVDAAPKKIVTVINNVLEYVAVVFTVAGSSPNFGEVTAGVDLGAFTNVLAGGPATIAGGY